MGSGEHSHIYDPSTRHTLCRSAIGRAKSPQQLYKSDADQVTCYRCVKLAQMNLEAGRQADEVSKTSRAKKNSSESDRLLLPWVTVTAAAWPPRPRLEVDLPQGLRLVVYQDEAHVYQDEAQKYFFLAYSYSYSYDEHRGYRSIASGQFWPTPEDAAREAETWLLGYAPSVYFTVVVSEEAKKNPGKAEKQTAKRRARRQKNSRQDMSFLPWYSREGRAWVDLPDGSRIGWFLNQWSGLQHINIYCSPDALGRLGLKHLFEFKTADEALDFAEEWVTEHYPAYVLSLASR